MIERHPIAFYAHGCYVTSMSKNERANVQAQKCSIKATYYNNIATLDYTLYGLFPDWT